MLELTERVGAKPKLVKRSMPGVSVSIGDTIPFDEADMPVQTKKTEDKKNAESKRV